MGRKLFYTKLNTIKIQQRWAVHTGNQNRDVLLL